MAKRRTITRYRTAKRRYGRKGTSGMKPILDGIIAGLAGQFASKYLGVYGHPVASIGVGYWRNNATLKTEGGRELGAALATMVPIIGGETPYGGGGY